ncbi:hypothetical protein BDV18DRAFT_133962 [Aspergillus unguis]
MNYPCPNRLHLPSNVQSPKIIYGVDAAMSVVLGLIVSALQASESVVSYDFTACDLASGRTRQILVSNVVGGPFGPKGLGTPVIYSSLPWD